MGILDRIKRQSVTKGAAMVNSSEFFKDTIVAKTDVPIVNLIMSGKIDGGLVRGITMLAAPPAHYKTLLGMKLVKAYLDTYDDAACIFLDSEYGGSIDYFKAQGVDIDRIFHVPIDTIENLKFEMVKQLQGFEKDDKVIFFIDSVGMLASTKELNDAISEKSASDMTRAKELASAMRLITPMLNKRKLPCIIINHVYKDISTLYGGNINAGGEKMQYASNTIIQITKSQEKDGKELLGFNFRLIANKSRFVREKTVLPLSVTFNGGINKWSGLFDLAVELGWITVPVQGWYIPINKTTGEILNENKQRRKELEYNSEFWEMLLKAGFAEALENHVSMAESYNE